MYSSRTPTLAIYIQHSFRYPRHSNQTRKINKRNPKSKVPWYKINIQKSAAFLYTKTNYQKGKWRKQSNLSLHQRGGKKITEINLHKEVYIPIPWELYNTDEVNWRQQRWNNTPCSWIEINYIMKMTYCQMESTHSTQSKSNYQWHFSVKLMIPPSLLFFLKIILVTQGLLCFQGNLKFLS